MVSNGDRLRWTNGISMWRWCEYVPPVEGECCSICIIYGDINFDNQINVIDVVQQVNFILGINFPDNNEYLAADISGDGLLNVLDVVSLVNIILGD